MLRNISNRIFGDIVLVFNRSEEFARNRLYILWFSIFANVVAILHGGYFFTGLLLQLGADDAYMGYITLTTYACSIFAIFSPLIIERFRKRKRILLITRGVWYVLLLVFITVIPYVGIENNARLAAILAIIALVNLISSLSDSGMSVWHLQSLPEGIRSSFFSNLNMIIGILNMLLLNLAGLFADYLKSSGQELLGIVLLRCVACLFAVVVIYNLSRIKEYPYAENPTKVNLKEVILTPFRNKRYRAVLAIIIIWTLTATIPGPFFQVYLLKDLKINYSFLSAVNLLNIPVLLIAMPIWGRVVARLGDIKLFPPLAAMAALHFLSLAFVTGDNYQWLYPISLLCYFVLAAGITQVASLMPFKFIPETNQSCYISCYGTVTTVAALAGTLIGQRIVIATELVNLPVIGISLGNKQLIVAIAGIAILAGAAAMSFIYRWLARSEKQTGG